MEGVQTLDQIAQEIQTASAQRETAKTESTSQGTVEQPWSPALVKTLSGWFLGFGLIVCAIMAALLIKKCKASDVLRAFSLPLIIVSAVFLVVTGYSDSQISSVIGLLGAIAGYILGSRDSKDPPAQVEAPKEPAKLKAVQD